MSSIVAETKIPISVLDRSLYFKCLLLLTRKDRQISSAEFQLMMKIGRCLDFERAFCKRAISEILDNQHIVDAPPQFSRPDIAEYFIKDGLTLGYCDHEIADSELEWLEASALANSVRLQAIIDAWKAGPYQGPDRPLEAERLKTVY